MIDFYFQKATAEHFPDMMAGWPSYHNDNVRKVEIEMPEEEPLSSMAKAIANLQRAQLTMLDVLSIYHDVLEDQERRIQNLEALLGE